jgi:uncharacterized protein (TIGR02145 family)
MKNIKVTWLLSFLMMGVALMLTTMCDDEKDEIDEPEAPELATSSVFKITDNSASVEAVISSTGSSELKSCGVCWCTSESPTTDDNASNYGTVTGAYVSTITGLSPNTTYHIRAYATNEDVTSYGNELEFTTAPLLIDYDGNVYHTVRIGSQIWMAENLKVTHFRNGEAIPYVEKNDEWEGLTSAAYCPVNNSEVYGEIYGNLYNCYAISDPRNLAPTGWHVSTDQDWKILEGTVDSQYKEGDAEWDKRFYRGSDAGGMLKSMADEWESPNTGAKDAFGFAALPGGYRGYDGFWELNLAAYFYTSTAIDGGSIVYRTLWHSKANVYRDYGYKFAGGSVRCVQD